MKILHPIKQKIKPNNLELFALQFLNPYAQDIETICSIPCNISKIWQMGHFSWGRGSILAWTGKAPDVCVSGILRFK